ncbi:hypothetical protein JCM31598_38510 [Desulfonatronum parangueonense]
MLAIGIHGDYHAVPMLLRIAHPGLHRAPGTEIQWEGDHPGAGHAGSGSSLVRASVIDDKDVAAGVMNYLADNISYGILLIPCWNDHQYGMECIWAGPTIRVEAAMAMGRVHVNYPLIKITIPSNHSAIF